MSNLIPDGWSVVKLDTTLDELIGGQSPNRKEFPARAGEYGILKTTAIDWGKYKPEFNQEILDGFIPNTKHEVKNNDILITKAGPVHRVGVVAHVLSASPKKLISGKMTLLRVKKTYSSRYIAYALSTEYSQKPLKESTTGMASSQTNFTHDALKKIPLYIPESKLEQEKISLILTSVDEVIEKTQAQIDKLKALKTGILQELFSKGLGHTAFKDSAVGKIPKKWQLLTLDSLSIAPICYGIVQVGEYVENGVRVMAIKNLGKGFQDNINKTSIEIENKYVRSRIKPKDLLISVKGTIGRVDVVPDFFEGNISRDIVRIRLSESVDSMYLKYFFQSTSGLQLIKLISVGTTRAELSVHTLKNTLVPVPDLSEQVEISRNIESVDKSIALKSNKLNQQKSIKKALMQDLLTGKVRVKVDS